MSLNEDTRQIRTGSLGWMIQRIAKQLDLAMDARLERHGLNLQQFAVMMTVLETDGLSQTEIGARFAMPAYAISRAIDHLEAQALLERKPHPTSRRTLTIHATQKGRDLSGELFSIVRDVNNELAAPLSDSDRAQFRSLLKRVLEANMGQKA